MKFIDKKKIGVALIEEGDLVEDHNENLFMVVCDPNEPTDRLCLICLNEFTIENCYYDTHEMYTRGYKLYAKNNKLTLTIEE